MITIVHVLETCGGQEDARFYTLDEDRTFATPSLAFDFMGDCLRCEPDLRFLVRYINPQLHLPFVSAEEIVRLYNETHPRFEGDSRGHPGKHEVIVWAAGESPVFAGFVEPGNFEQDAELCAKWEA